MAEFCYVCPACLGSGIGQKVYIVHLQEHDEIQIEVINEPVCGWCFGRGCETRGEGVLTTCPEWECGMTSTLLPIRTSRAGHLEYKCWYCGHVWDEYIDDNRYIVEEWGGNTYVIEAHTYLKYYVQWLNKKHERK